MNCKWIKLFIYNSEVVSIKKYLFIFVYKQTKLDQIVHIQLGLVSIKFICSYLFIYKQAKLDQEKKFAFFNLPRNQYIALQEAISRGGKKFSVPIIIIIGTYVTTHKCHSRTRYARTTLELVFLVQHHSIT